MNINNEYMPQDPRDQESQRGNQEQDQTEMDHQNTDHGQETSDDREAAPMDDDMTDASRSAHDQDELIPIVNEEEKEPGGEDNEGSDQGDDEDLEDETDDEEEGDEALDDDEDQDEESERGRDTTMKNPGDEDSSPANNPYETNFEDPAQNRKTDPMTDHEPRIAGI